MTGRFGGTSETGTDGGENTLVPYSGLAEIYDRVMDHVDYGIWGAYINSIFKRFNLQGFDILEIACGTGNLAIELAKLGYSMIGSDISPPMLKVAAEKFHRNGFPVRFFSSSMTTIPLNRRFNAVVCIYDSINYLTEAEDIVKTFYETESVLEDGGIFVFDVCTVKNSEMFFAHHSMIENFGDVRCERICKYDRKKRIQENHFTIQKMGVRKSESHYQRIYRLDEIGSMIDRSPLMELGRYDDMSFLPGTEDSERVHFVLGRRP